MSRLNDFIVSKLFSILLGVFLLSLPATAQTDNCCGIDRQCSTNDEWVRGYYAFQNNECAAPSQPMQAQAQQQAQIRRSPPSINNCCFSGWQCDDNEEWLSGFWAFQNDHCAVQAHWEAQWRRQNGGAGSASIEQRQPEDQHYSTSLKRQGRPQASADPWLGIPRWRWFCGGVPCAPNPNPGRTVSITVDLTDPNRRVQETDDGAFVVLDPDLPDETEETPP